MNRKYKKRRWKECFKAFLNEEFLVRNQDEIQWNEGLMDKLNKVKVLSMISKMMYRRVVRPDGLPIEVYKVLRGNWVKW